MIGSSAEGTGIVGPFLTLFGLGGRIGSGFGAKGRFLRLSFAGSVGFSSGLGFSLGLGATGGGTGLGFGLILDFGGLGGLGLGFGGTPIYFVKSSLGFILVSNSIKISATKIST